MNDNNQSFDLMITYIQKLSKNRFRRGIDNSTIDP